MENKKSIFEKLKLIERVENKPTEMLKDVEIDTSEVKEEKKKETVNQQKKETDNTQFKLNTLLNIKEVYKKYNLPEDSKETIFLIDSFAKALPEYLPVDIKRQSVLNIISSSGMNIVNLLKDGNDRLKLLKTFSDEASNYTSKLVNEYENEIEKLTATINKYKKEISERKQLLEEQRNIVEYETQKVQNIIQFINPAK